jgi:hypothetical protein
MASNPGLAIANILCKVDGPGDAAEAAAWAASYNLTNVMVWGDTTDYMYTNFGQALDGSYPFTMVVDIDTMELVYLQGGDSSGAMSSIQAILNADHTCADY